MEGRRLTSSPCSPLSDSRSSTNKENIPSSGASSGSSSGSVGEDSGSSVRSHAGLSGHPERAHKPRKQKYSTMLVQLSDNQHAHAVSHPASSPHRSSSLSACHSFGSVSPALL